MNLKTIVALAALSFLGGVSGAAACGGFGEMCRSSLVFWPVYTETERHIGVVEVPVRPMPHFETSRFTGQPITVLYDNPGRLPGAVDPDLRLVPLPHVKRSRTVGY